MGLSNFGSIGNATAHRIHGVHWHLLHQFLFCWRISEQHCLGQRDQNIQETKVNANTKFERKEEQIYLLTMLNIYIGFIVAIPWRIKRKWKWTLLPMSQIKQFIETQSKRKVCNPLESLFPYSKFHCLIKKSLKDLL